MKTFHERLYAMLDDYAHDVYRVTKTFPREELYGATSQLRRASLSVILNYIEGYARGRTKVNKNFLEIAYGSLKESQYLIGFGIKENFLTQLQGAELLRRADELGGMLWGIISKL